MRRIFAAAAAATLILAHSTTPSVASEVRILFNVFFPPQHFLNREVFPGWAAEIAEATQGRVKINFPAKSLSPPPKQFETVTQGVADGALIFNGFLENQVTTPLVAHIPWVATDSAEAASVSLWRTYDRFFRPAGEYRDVQLISLFTAAPGEFFSLTDTPITTLDHLTGRKLWVLPGALAETIKGLKAPIVSGPAVQIHEMVSRGVVDGFIGISFVDADSFRAIDYAKSATIFRRKAFTPGFSVFLNRDKWRQITPADQQTVLQLSGEHLARLAGRAYDHHNGRSRASWIASGARLVDPPAALSATLEAASAHIERQWVDKVKAMGVDGAAALAFYKSEVLRLTPATR